MPGRPPKPPGTRARSGRDSPQWRVLEGGRRVKAPTLSLAGLPRPLHAAARAWWGTVWASPMAQAYLPADRLALSRAARLAARELHGDLSGTELGELRQLEDRFGLSPRARRSLMWLTGPAAEPRQQPVDALAARRVTRSVHRNPLDALTDHPPAEEAP